MTTDINNQSLAQLRHRFSRLQPPEMSEMKGKYYVNIVGPKGLRKLMRLVLSLSGLGDWYGKEFLSTKVAVNLVKNRDKSEHKLPMKIHKISSFVDGRASLALLHSKKAAFPWWLVVVELRRLDKGRLLALMALDFPGLRRLAIPILLVQEPAEQIFDYVVIGSGYGGSVAAMRLAQKGYRVAIVEQGRRVSSQDMEKAARNPLRLLWAPLLGLKGFFNQALFRHFSVGRGIGVGGGSLVSAAILSRPIRAFFKSSAWGVEATDWQEELEPFYKIAEKMLGARTSPYQGQTDEYLKDTAQRLECGDSFGRVSLGIYFSNPGKKVKDPYFGGKGPIRSGCIQCGNCLSGCAHGAKNSLDKNYLYLAEKMGTYILSERRVTAIQPSPAGGYVVDIQNTFARKEFHYPMTAKKVILAAGVLGTTELLLKCKHELQTLPKLSDKLGHRVRINHESTVGVLSKDQTLDLSQGTTTSSAFYVDKRIHVAQVRYPPSYFYLKCLFGPLVDGAIVKQRRWQALGWLFLRPWYATATWRAKNWHQRMSVLTATQVRKTEMRFEYESSWTSGFKKTLRPVAVADETSVYMPEANVVADVFAQEAYGSAHSMMLESVGNLLMSNQILGGCPVGRNKKEGVINLNHEVFDYPGFYVLDASSIPANVGVNPSLTIAALAERCISKIPRKG